MAYLRTLAVLTLAVGVFGLGAVVGGGFSRPTMPIAGGIRVPAADVFAPSTLGPVGGTGQVRRPRFKVELISIDAVDETGWDWTGSDEPVVVSDTAEHRIHTSVFEDVDSGDVVTIPPSQSCIWPIADVGDASWTCKPEGGAAPLRFVVSLWEWDDPAPLGGFCVFRGGVMPAGAELPCRDSLGWLFSSGVHSYSEADLVKELPSPGMSFDVKPKFIQHGALGTGWEYGLTVRVTRVGDYVEDRPVER